MQGKYIYEYSIIRLVPRVEREEFINIGVLLYCKSENYLKVHFVLNSDKILTLHSGIDLTIVEKYIEEIHNIVNGKCSNEFLKSLDIPSKFRWLSAKKSTMLQYAPIHVGKSENLDNTLENLINLFVK
jgi:hypothetical protein